jgi:hypothetical protein
MSTRGHLQNELRFEQIFVTDSAISHIGPIPVLLLNNSKPSLFNLFPLKFKNVLGTFS